MVALPVVFLLAVYGSGLMSSKSVSVTVDGVPVAEVLTRAANVAEVLAEAGIELEEADEVMPALDASVNDGDTIAVTRAITVVLRVDGVEQTLAISGGTVRDALVRAGVRMGELDRVIPVRTVELAEGMEIEVIRVVQEEIVETETIPYRTLRWAEPALLQGEERIIQEGREGILEKRVLLTYENGSMVHRRELSHEVVQEASPEIIGVGTREAVQAIETATGTYRYTKVIDMLATAYYPGPESTGEWADGYTYTGLRAGYGVVAVDPSVIPLGARLYVPGYGEAIAADIGGAIKGNRIDLGFETYEEAIEYGVQQVQVYVLAQ